MNICCCLPNSGFLCVILVHFIVTSTSYVEGNDSASTASALKRGKFNHTGNFVTSGSWASSNSERNRITKQFAFILGLVNNRSKKYKHSKRRHDSRTRHKHVHPHTHRSKQKSELKIKSNLPLEDRTDVKSRNMTYGPGRPIDWNIIARTHSVVFELDEENDLKPQIGPSSHVESATVSTLTRGPSLVQGNHSLSLLDKMIAWKDNQKSNLYNMTKGSSLWIGVGAGVCSSAALIILVSLIYRIFRKRRARCSKLKELTVGTPTEDKPIYIKLSQLHRPKRSPNYVVTVLDESNFSLDSDEDSSEEELFDLSAIAVGSPYKSTIKNNNLLENQNKTSTPKKDNITRDVQ